MGDGRRRSAADLLPAALVVAREIGVSRLADVTRLDRIGLPCWQAVRPMGRSLSVHQGKGLTDEQAKVGAILEAFEAHCAERCDEPVLTCRFDQLGSDVRPPTLQDFSKDASVPIPSHQAVPWLMASRVDGDDIAIPWACVSMDFTRLVRSPFDRSSNGVAVGTTRDEAIFAALLELVERDAVAEWKRLPMLDRMTSQIDLDGCGFPWVAVWRDRLRACNAFLRCYRVPSFTGVPVVACEVGQSEKAATPFHAIHGHSAHSIPEVALFRAMAEAVQGRAAYIAGSRDDLLPSEYSEAVTSVRVAFGMPRPASMTGADFGQIGAGPADAATVIKGIESVGLGPVAVIDLGVFEPFHCVRVLALGLASRQRRRRATC